MDKAVFEGKQCAKLERLFIVFRRISVLIDGIRKNVVHSERILFYQDYG